MSRLRNFSFSAFWFACALLVTAHVSARDIDRFLSGSWYNPAQSGHGFSVEVSANGQVVFYWYTYHPDGTPTFIIAAGQAQGNKVTAEAFYNTGMHFGVFDPDERTESPWGTITITFHDCHSATVEYSSTFEHDSMAFGSGSFPIQRLVSIDQLQCQEDRRAGIYEGNNGYGDFYASSVLYRRMITLADLAGGYAVRNPITGFTGNAAGDAKPSVNAQNAFEPAMQGTFQQVVVRHAVGQYKHGI
jgi:hypothetical protein